MGAGFEPSLAEGRPGAPVAERYVCSRLIGARERTMPEFHCHMLDARGAILSRTDIIAESLDFAIRHASDILHRSNQSSSPSRRVFAFEVWAGTNRLFPEQPVVKVGTMAIH